MASRQQQRLSKLLRIAEALPEIEVTGDQHLAFRIRKKTFAYYLNNHHGDGIVSVCCKANFDAQSTLVETDPERFYVPAYIGAKGWVAMRLDQGGVDWALLSDLLVNAYRAQAPRTLARRLE